MSEKIELEFAKLPPPGTPSMGKDYFDGFHPRTDLLPAGYTFEPGRRSFPTATYVDWDTGVKMRDGITIYMDVYRPVGDEKVPAIISWGPAGKRGKNNMLDGMGMPHEMPEGGPGGPDGGPGGMEGFDDWAGRGGMPKMPVSHSSPPRMGIPFDRLSGLQAWESLDPAEWVQYGYAIVQVDPRGCYMSEGDVRYFGKLDAEDIYDTIEALARMDWCSGKVAMGGSSWYAMTQWCAASYNPPHLCAIAPWEGEGDLYRDEYLRGGIPMAAMSSASRTTGNGYIEDIGAMIKKYPLYNEYWEDKSWKFENIKIPCYIVASYGSQMHCRGAFDGFRRAGTADKWLRVHNQQEWVDLYDPEQQADCRRFYDHFLKGKNNGWEYTPHVRLAILKPGGKDRVLVPEETFPLARQELKKYWLDASDMSLKTQNGQTASVSYECGEDEGKCSFTMSFDKDTTLVGYCKIKLWVEAQGYDDMDLFVRIMNTDGDGNILYQDSICFLYTGPDAMLRVSMRELDKEKSTEEEPLQTFRSVQKLKPGEIVPVEMAFWPTGMTFNKGEKLELVIAGYDYMPSRAQDRPTSIVDSKGVHIIHTGGDYDSYLLLPVIPDL